MSKLWDCAIVPAITPYLGKLDVGSGMRFCPFNGHPDMCKEVAKEYGGFYARIAYLEISRPKERS